MNVRKCASDPDAMVMLPAALTSVSAPLIKETMRWQVAAHTGNWPPSSHSFPLENHPSLPFLFLSFFWLVPSSYLAFSETCQWAGRNARLCEIMIRMDGDEGKGVAHFPTSL